MPKFKARFTKEHEAEIDAADVAAAAEMMPHHLRAVPDTRLVGVIAFDQEWPDADTGETAATRPRPRGGPPSGGTPGTPVIRLEDQPVSAVAA